MDNKTTGSILLVAGTAIGAGMLALPITTGAAGFWPAIGVFGLGFIYMMINLALLLEALLYEEDRTINIISIAGKWLGVWGQIVAWLSFMLLMYSASAAYLAEGGKIIANLLDSIVHISPHIITTILAGGAAILTLSGVGLVDFINRGFMYGLFISYFALIYYVAPHIEISNLADHTSTNLAATLPIVVLSFTSHIILPSLREYLNDDLGEIKKTLIIGNIFPLVFYIVWLLLILGLVPLTGPHSLASIVDAPDTLSALFGKFQNSETLHNIGISQNWFALCALVTSFLAVCLSLKDFIVDGMHLRQKIPNPQASSMVGTGLALVPPLFFAIFFPNGFEAAIGYAGIFVAILFGILPGLIVYQARNHHHHAKFRCWGGTGLLVVQVTIAVFIIYAQLVA